MDFSPLVPLGHTLSHFPFAQASALIEPHWINENMSKLLACLVY